MSQEIQLSLSPNPATQQQASSWGAPVSSALAPVNPQETPLALVHAHLRGRYGLTVILAIVFAVVGGAVGYSFFHQGYQSNGLIEIFPVIPTPETADLIMPLYMQYVQTVVTTLKSETVIKEAMKDPNWKAYRKGPADAYIGEWNKNLLVKVVPNSYYIQVTYTDERPDGQKVAPIAVQSLIKAYSNLFGNEQAIEIDKKIEVWKNVVTQMNQKLNRNHDLIETLTHGVGDDPQAVFTEKMRQHLALDERIHTAEFELQQDEDGLKKAQEMQGPYTIEDLARVDPAMEEMYRIRTQLELETEELETRLGKLNPAARARRQELDLRNIQMDKYRNQLSATKFIQRKPDGSGGVLLNRDLSIQEDNLKRMRDLYVQQQQEVEDLSRRTHEVVYYRAQNIRFEEDLAVASKKVLAFQSEKDMANTFRVTDPGGQASVGNDKRIAVGALGMILGGAFPVGLMLLASLMNPRFRFSDEATGKPTTGLTLLGILPDLPDRLSDPEQASIAAHCVHQIRTMLQINTGMDDRRVFAITSAAPGDGKTSLTLALGLSYAACGTRTLLIDCDLIGSGLTTRMNVAAGDGVLEAIAHRSLLEYVRTTDIADVSILPVGSGQQLHASTLSPAALRRLIEEARKHYDTILIDTGPVLGSIEASLVAAAADAVVLAVSRGQQRPLVERTVAHLQHIKANLAGVVFNRAKNADFDRSISGLSLRSATAGQGHNGSPRMGPVARAVQSAFQPAGEDLGPETR